MNIKLFSSLLGVALGLAIPCAPALSQTYPAKPVQLVVPLAAGGPTDAVGRLIAKALGERLGQPVVVDNKPGAGGLVGTEAVVRAPADGYTLLLSTSSLAIFPSLFKTQLSPDRDLTAVASVAISPLLLVVSPNVTASTMAELIAMARKQPGALTYASAGLGSNSHLAGELFKHKTGIDILHVPYRSTGAAMQDVLAGRVTMVFDNIVTALPLIKAGKLKVLAVASEQRSTLLPDAPTLIESNVPEYEYSTWFGVVAPKGTPRPVVDRLSRELEAVVNDPNVQQILQMQGLDKYYLPSARFAEVVRGDVRKWDTRIKAMNLQKVDQ